MTYEILCQDRDKEPDPNGTWPSVFLASFNAESWPVARERANQIVRQHCGDNVGDWFNADNGPEMYCTPDRRSIPKSYTLRPVREIAVRHLSPEDLYGGLL